MPYLLSLTKTMGPQVEHACSAETKDTSELVSHRPAADDHGDPDDQRQSGTDLRACRRSTHGFPLRHLRIEPELIDGSIDPQHQEQDQLRPEERIPICFASLGQ